MSDITLTTITSGYNLSLLNKNFDTIENSINLDVVHLAGGNNTMQQDLDMNSNNLLNISALNASDINTTYLSLNGKTVTDGNLIVTDAVLRTQLADVGSGNGADMVGFKQNLTNAVSTTLLSKLEESVSVKDFGAKGDGSTDDTIAINNALAANLHVIFPSGQYRVQPTGFSLRSNQVVEFRGGASIKLLAHNTDTYQIFKVFDVNNVKIINAYLDGSRELNSASSGEFGMGISICGSTNVIIDNATTIGCWGDGIYIGSTKTTGLSYSKNIIINDHYAYNCRRQGMSVISVKTLKCNNPIYDTINGTSPQSGFDIEPNSNTQSLEDIIINNPTSISCSGYGGVVSLENFSGASTVNNVSIIVNNHKDYGSFGGIEVAAVNTSSTSGISGEIVFNNPVWSNNNMGVLMRSYPSTFPKVKIINPKIYNCNINGSSSATTGSVFICYSPSNDNGTYSIGNLYIEGVSIYSNLTNTPVALLWVADSRSGASNPSNFWWLNPNHIDSVVNTKRVSFGTSTSTYFSDPTNNQQFPLAGSLTYNMDVHNPIINVASTFTLPSTYTSSMCDIKVTCNQSSGSVYIKPPTGGNFINYAINSQLTSSVKGSFLIIRPLGNSQYMIVSQGGSWSNT